MQDTGLLLAALRPPTAVAAIAAIRERSWRQRSHYRTLSRASRWQDLAESCQGDLELGRIDLARLRGGIRDLRYLRSQLKRNAAGLRRVIAPATTAGKAKGERPKFDRAAARKLEKLLAEIEQATIPGSFVLSSARAFLVLQGAAIQGVIDAELGQYLVPERREALLRLAATFWLDPHARDLAVAVTRHRAALNGMQRRAYLGALRNRSTLAQAFQNLADWVVREIRNIVALQEFLSAVLEHAAVSASPVDLTILNAAAIDAGMLIREATASYLASLVGILALHGISLHYDAGSVLAKASSLPFHGQMAAGKRTSARRLGRLPDGMLVKIEGMIEAATYVPASGKRGGYFLAKLRTPIDGGTVSVVASQDLAAHGLRRGSRARLSGIFRKNGSPLHEKKHVEIDRLKIRETYAQDFWRVAFLDLSTPYFNLWPGYLDLGFQVVPDVAGAANAERGGGPVVALGECEPEWLQVIQATRDLTSAQHDLQIATLLDASAAAWAWVACHPLGPTCLQAQRALIAATELLLLALAASRRAQQALADAWAVYNECLTTSTGVSSDDGGNDGDDPGGGVADDESSLLEGSVDSHPEGSNVSGASSISFGTSLSSSGDDHGPSV
jgi:hypothetical protein